MLWKSEKIETVLHNVIILLTKYDVTYSVNKIQFNQNNKHYKRLIMFSCENNYTHINMRS